MTEIHDHMGWLFRVAVNDIPHPTSYCTRYLRGQPCNCGIEEAIKWLDESRIARYLDHYRKHGKVPA